MTDQAPGVTKAVSHLYQVFSDYPRPHTASGCTHCYDPEEFEYLRSTPLSSLSPTMTRTLLWETGDHWESTAAYKHSRRWPSMTSEAGHPKSARRC